jgi:hypothetical protein
MKQQARSFARASLSLALIAIPIACGGSATQDSTVPAGTAGAPSGGAGEPPLGVGGTGGSFGVGGTAGSLALPVGGAAGAAPRAAIDFELRVAQGASSTYCVGTNNLQCIPGWLSIRSASGDELALDPQRCAASCEACQPVACSAICLEPTAIGPGGVDRTFDGSSHAFRLCGSDVSCESPDGSTAPGNYIAKLCGYLGSTQGSAPACDLSVPNAPPTCVEIPFVWPPAVSGTTLVGVIGGPDISTSEAGAAGAP